jgi:hypothetical protein
MNLLTLNRIFIGALLLVVSHATALADPVTGQVTKVEGTAYLISPSGKSHVVVAGMPVAAAVHLLPGADTVFPPNTNVSFTSLDYTVSSSNEATRKMRLSVTKGTVFFNLVHGGGTTDFKVKTPKGVAAARGTRGSITVTIDNVVIKVTQGTIVFTFPDGKTLTIPAGFSGSTISQQISKLSASDIKALATVLADFLGVLESGGGGGPGGTSGGGGGNLNPGNTTSPEQ